MRHQDVISALGATAADLIGLARHLKLNAGDAIDPSCSDMHLWAEEARVSAGACIAAINHLNGASPE